MAFDVVNEETVYLCTGNPLPSTIKKITKWLLNENYQTAFESKALPFLPYFSGVSSIQQAQGLALQDILRDIHGYLGLINFTDDMLVLLYKKLAEIEYRLDVGGNDKLQLGALVSVFQIIREEVSKHVDER